MHSLALRIPLFTFTVIKTKDTVQCFNRKTIGQISRHNGVSSFNFKSPSTLAEATATVCVRKRAPAGARSHVSLHRIRTHPTRQVPMFTTHTNHSTRFKVKVFISPDISDPLIQRCPERNCGRNLKSIYRHLTR